MYSYKSVSQRFIPDNEPPIIRRISLNGECVPIFEFHMAGETYYEWCHSYIIGNSYGGISIVSYVPRLANEGRWLYELYLSNWHIVSMQWPTLCCDFENSHSEGIFIPYNNKCPYSKIFVAPFWDFHGESRGNLWCVAKVLINLRQENLIDFPNRLTKLELQYIRKSAIEILLHCKKINDEIKRKCSIETMTQISNILRYNPFVNNGGPFHIIEGYSVKFDYKIKICAILAEHSYRDSKNKLPEYCRLIERLVDKRSGVSASVYSIYDDEIICAFPGSTNNIKDWENNLITQPFGVSEQYNKALDFAKLIQVKYGNNVLYVGHSKGGGEAAYCAASLGANAVIFNPAWLSNLTIDTSLVNNSKIDSYVFWNDVLNIGQEVLSFACPILNRYIQTYLISDYMPENMNVGDWHGMEGILRYFGVRV